MKAANFVFLLSCLIAITGCSTFKIASQWGQNSAFVLGDQTKYEKDLIVYCRDYKYDTILLAYNNILFDVRNKDSLPSIDFSSHCVTPVSAEYPTLLRCPKIEKGIAECQKNKKKVLLAIGGPTGDVTFPSPGKAREYANTVWELFLGGRGFPNLRPFGGAVLDGVAMVAEGGRKEYIADFARETKLLASKDTSRSYVFTVKSYCPYPDHFVGPGAGTLLEEASFIDELYVAFYDNNCDVDTHFKQWLDYSKEKNGPKVFFGTPAHPKAASQEKYYRTVSELQLILQKLASNAKFGGVFLQEASMDQNNVQDGKVFSEHIASILSQLEVPTTAPPTEPPTQPTGFTCQGKDDGNYADPNDCSKYYVCEHGVIKSHLSCPDGLKYNSAIKSCDWPQNVTCP